MRRTWVYGASLVALAAVGACAGDDAAGTSFTPPASTSETGTGTDPSITTGASITETGTADGGMSTGMVDDSTDGGMDTTGDPDTGDSGTTGSMADACDEVDIPDINGLDENNDGLDGVLGCSIFVNASTGSDLNDGDTPDVPVATIERGIEIASTYNPPRPVLVAAGTYNETVNLDSGVSLYGGYDNATWDRDVFQNPTIIEGDEFRAVVAINLNEAVEVDGFTIRGQDFMDGSQSTYGVWVRDTPEGLLTIDYCTIEAGNAGSGADGQNGGDGEDGGGGGNGLSNGTQGAGGVSGCGAVGGPGGDGGSCPSTNGQTGSAGGDATAVGSGGGAGVSHCGDGCDDTGSNGTMGLAGSVGVNGLGGQMASDNDGDFGGDGLWVPPQGALSTRGANGGGGGGGGAGGFDEDAGIFCTFDSGNGIGGGGGGGGAGGCGGIEGGVGEAGGGSFGLVAFNSSVDVSNTDFVLGAGGNGGDGGDGGDGGLGASPGSGANGTDNGGEPGNGAGGGAGGGGGGGGGGSGGCGGSAIGIAEVGSSSVGVANVSFSGGAAGSAGSGGVGGLRADGVGLSAPNGANGCAGVVSDERAY